MRKPGYRSSTHICKRCAGTAKEVKPVKRSGPSCYR